jgi:hypothetical protein
MKEYEVETDLDEYAMGRVIGVARLIHEGHVIREVLGNDEAHALECLRREMGVMREALDSCEALRAKTSENFELDRARKRVVELERRVSVATTLLYRGIESDVTGGASKAAIAMLANGDDEAAISVVETTLRARYPGVRWRLQRTK